MELQQKNQDQFVENHADIELNKPSKSRFLFLLFFFGYFIFAFAGCYNLYEHKFQKNADIPAPDNTLYDPKYK